MKNVTKIAGIIAMVAILALAVSCSKNEASSGTNGGSTETVASTAKSGDGLAGTVWEGTDGNGTVRKYTFAETDSMVLQQWDGNTSQGFYRIFGDTLMVTWQSGTEVEYTLSGDTMNEKGGNITITKVK